MSKSALTAHMVVKNDDQFVWHALQSVLPYVDHLFISDTGSSDQTVAIIKRFKSPRIDLEQHSHASATEIVAIRQHQLERTKTPWVWIVDADEIYPQKTVREIQAHLQPRYAGMWVRRYDCLGDIYHYQPDERVGGYTFFDHPYHANLRLVRRDISGLTYYGIYPQEGFIDGAGKKLIDYPPEKMYLSTHRYLHASYLVRSSNKASSRTTFFRHKHKCEWGKPIPTADLPDIVTAHPLPKRSLQYQLGAAIITPLKMLKRRFL